MKKLKAIWAKAKAAGQKFRAMPRLVQDGSIGLTGLLLGRLGAPWFF